MKSFSYSLVLSLLAVFTLSSCLGDEKTEYSDYCYISSFSLGYVKQIHHVKDSVGRDSTYTTSYSAAGFPMSINQRENTIENIDSLPYGSQLDKVLTTCNFQSVLVHRPKDINGLDPQDTLWVTYSSSDSIDFKKPREFLVFAADGSSMRYYTVKVNVHQMDPEETVWDSLGVSTIPYPADCKARKMVALNGNIEVLTQAQDGTISGFSRKAKKEGEWESIALIGAEGLVLETLQSENGTTYASTEDGRIIYSTDGQTWNTRMLGLSGLRLAGVSQNCFYAIQDGKLMCTPKSSENWQEETLDEDSSFLPTQELTILSFTQKNGNERLLLSGKSADGTKARLWSKMWVKQTGSELQSGWAFYNDNAAIKDKIPVLEHSNIMYYNGGILLFGGASIPGTDVNSKPLANLYFSQDYGITWQKHATMALDNRMAKTASNAGCINAALQDDKYIWVLIDGQLWRGRFNGVAFE